MMSWHEILEAVALETPEERLAKLHQSQRVADGTHAENMRQHRIAMAHRLSDLGERFASRSFASYRVPPGDAAALDVMRSLEVLTEGAWLYGAPGTGKSHLAGAVVLAANEIGIAASFTTALSMLDRIKKSYRGDRVRDGEIDVIDRYAAVPVLVFDDIDKAEFTSHASQRIYALVNTRYEHNLPLIVTSNMSPAELGNRWKQQGLDPIISGAILDRMNEMCTHFVHVQGRSVRGRI